jgi:hypothetical protein
MGMPMVTLEAVVKPDGTLELGQRVALPPGRVQVTIVPLPELPSNDPFRQQLAKGTPMEPPAREFPRWPGTVLGTLSREEIYDDRA